MNDRYNIIISHDWLGSQDILLGKLGNLILDFIYKGTLHNTAPFDIRNTIGTQPRISTIYENSYSVSEGFKRVLQMAMYRNQSMLTPETTALIKNALLTFESFTEICQNLTSDMFTRSFTPARAQELNTKFVEEAENVIKLINMIDDTMRNESNESNELTFVDVMTDQLGFRFGRSFNMRSRKAKKSPKRSRKVKKSVKRSRKTRKSVKRSRKTTRRSRR